MASYEGNPKTEKRLLDNPVVGSLVVPIAIVLVGALIVIGVTRMLSTDRSYKDLVREMQSKTFGNRWIAAYELSKVINSSAIPEDELPWFVGEMTELYRSSTDPRTREFIVVALGALKEEAAVPALMDALSDEAGDVKFHALYALGNLPAGLQVDWTRVQAFLDHEDFALRHAALLVLAQHRVEGMQPVFEGHLNDSAMSVRYAAAMALIPHQSEQARPLLEKVLLAESGTPLLLDDAKLIELQVNIASLIGQEGWLDFADVLNEVAQLNRNPRLTAKAREVLNVLKN